MKIIDAHAHFFGEKPKCLEILRKLDVRMINICVAETPKTNWRVEQKEPYKKLAQNHPDRYAWCTTVDVPRFDDPEYVEKSIAELDRDFEDGAIACKVWKNLGMQLRSPSGKYFMVDDPILEPIFSYIEKVRKPLIMHIAEPVQSWQPLETLPKDYQAYLTNYPEDYMYGKPDAPSHAELMRARDKVIERHPNMIVIGAHFGSLEHDFREIAKRFDQYPNFVVDTSARITYIAKQDQQAVKQFLTKYQDRVLYGSDMILDIQQLTMPQSELERKVENLKAITETMLALLGTEERVTYRGHEMMGLGLPKDVTKNLFFNNALKWFPNLKW